MSSIRRDFIPAASLLRNHGDASPPAGPVPAGVLQGEDFDERPNESSRRRFLELMGASLMLAGATGCTRQPTEFILPYVEPPETAIPGRPRYYATAVPAIGSPLHRGTFWLIGAPPRSYRETTSPRSFMPWPHAMNLALGNSGNTVIHTTPVEVQPVDQVASLRELVRDLDAGSVEVLLMLGAYGKSWDEDVVVDPTTDSLAISGGDRVA